MNNQQPLFRPKLVIFSQNGITLPITKSRNDRGLFSIDSHHKSRNCWKVMPFFSKPHISSCDKCDDECATDFRSSDLWHLWPDCHKCWDHIFLWQSGICKPKQRPLFAMNLLNGNLLYMLLNAVTRNYSCPTWKNGVSLANVKKIA